MAELIGGQQFGDVAFGDTGTESVPGAAPTQQLTGKLLKLDGAPAVGVSVSIRSRRRQIISGATIGVDILTASTGIDGVFNFVVVKGLKAQVQIGTYVIRINITEDDVKDIATYVEVYN